MIAQTHIISSPTAHKEAAEWLARYGVTSKPFDWYHQPGFNQIGSGNSHAHYATDDNAIIIHERYEGSGSIRVITLYENKATYSQAVTEYRKLTDKDPETGKYRFPR
jgi:hypothetical protein